MNIATQRPVITWKLASGYRSTRYLLIGHTIFSVASVSGSLHPTEVRSWLCASDGDARVQAAWLTEQDEIRGLVLRGGVMRCTVECSVDLLLNLASREDQTHAAKELNSIEKAVRIMGETLR